MQARYYDPVIGRFYSNDPISTLGHANTENGIIHGFNRYAYGNNNPYKYVDPDGRSSYNPQGMVRQHQDFNKVRIANGVSNGQALADLTGVSDAVDAVNNVLSSDLTGAAVSAVGALCKACKAGTMQRKLEKGQIPKKAQIDRFDPADSKQPGSKDHVHFKDGTSMNNDGTPHDKHKGTPNPNKAARKVLKENNWADKPKDNQ